MRNDISYLKKEKKKKTSLHTGTSFRNTVGIKH